MVGLVSPMLPKWLVWFWTCWLPMVTNTTSGNLRAPIGRLYFLKMYLVYVLRYVPQLGCATTRFVTRQQSAFREERV